MQKAVGGSGPTGEEAGGSGGAASSVLSFSDAANSISASSVTGTSIAIGGDGGGGYYSDGAGGNATSTITLSGANAVTATADATGGTPGGENYTSDGSATASSLATASSNGPSGTAVSTANAAGGTYKLLPYSEILGGTATATSTTTTASGQLANATSSATSANAASAGSTAETNGTDLVSTVTASTLSTAIGTTTTQAEAQSATAFTFGGSTQSDYAYVTSQPTSFSLAFDPQVATELASADLVGASWQGGYYVSGSSGNQEYKSTTSFTLNAQNLSGALVAGLLTSQSFGTGFTSLSFSAVVAGVTVVSQTYTTLAAAQAYFNDQVLSLGAVTPVAGLTVSFNFDLLSSTANSGFGAEIVLGVTPPLLLTAPPNALLTYGTANALPGISLSEAAAQSGETFTVTLSDKSGTLSATGTGVSGAGSNHLTLAGSLAQVNADLATLTDTATSADSIAITATDSIGNTSSETIAVSVRQPNPFAVYAVLATLDGVQQTVFINADARDYAAFYAGGLTNNLPLNAATFPGDTASGAFQNLIVPAGNSATNVVNGAGYSTIVIGNTSEIVTLSGGGVASGVQTILASDSGLDFTSVDATNTILFSGGGNSNISFAGSSGQDKIFLSAGNNTVTAGSGATTIDAGVGNNAITAGAGPTTILVEGRDSITLSGGLAGIYVGPLGGEADSASALVYGDTSQTTASTIFFQARGTQVSTVFGGTSGNDTILAGAGGGVFFGGSGGNNILEGGSGAVTLAAGGSGDYLVGSTGGADSLVAGAGNGVILYAQASNDTLVGGTGTAIFEIAGADTVHLRSGSATVAAGPAAGSSVDNAHAYVTGGAGNLLFYGGANASTVTSGAGSDTVFANGGGGVFAGGSGGGNILIGGTNAVTLTAAGSNNYLQGSTQGGDSLSGGSGSNTTIVALANGDTISGGSGNDTIDVLAASDTVNAGSGAETVQVALGTSVNGGSGSLFFVGGSQASTVLGGSGTETIFTGLGGGYFSAGSTGANVIIATGYAATLVGANGSYLQGNSGAAVANLLEAGAGNETLVAGLGADTLAGSATGSDVFSFTQSAANQTYTITSFHSGDALYMADQATVTYALMHQITSGSATTLSLADGTTIIVQGASSPLTSAAFGHA